MMKDLIFPALGDGNVPSSFLLRESRMKDLIFPALGDGNAAAFVPEPLAFRRI